jgi:RNA polymerase sigma factor (sigma-70 family)
VVIISGMSRLGRRHYDRRMAWTGEEGGRDRVALLRQVIDHHGPALELYARQWCEDAADIVQECLVKFAAQPRPPDNPAAWLYRAVRNRAITAARAARRRRRHEAAAVEHRRPWFTTNNGQQLDAAAASEALAGLPLEEREVVIAHLWGGLTFEQIGELAGCSSSTAHRRYLAALAALREKLRIP